MGLQDGNDHKLNFDTESKDARHSWRKVVSKYETPNLARSLGQIGNTIIPYLALLYLMYLSLDFSYWITLGISIPTSGFLVRNFIIFHDCGHGSFFKSRKANQIVGFFSGLLSFMPFYFWSHQHGKHHATSGDLDRRGDGDVWTVTVQEYLEMPRWKKIWYRTYRNPLFLFGVIPLYFFLVYYRYWLPGDNKRVRWSAMKTNVAVVSLVGLASFTIGFKAYVMIQLPIMVITGAVGFWLFYVQHQFEHTYWERHEEWDYVRHALEGSSFYKLPKLLQWFSGNIGFHHVHHLSPRIPNYNLQACHEADPMFQEVKHVTLWSSFRSLRYRLWDENRKKLVGFNYIPVYLARNQSRASR